MTELPADLRHRLVLVRQLDRVGLDDREIRRQRDAGALVRIRRGCYISRIEWEAMNPRERHIARAHAVAANASIEPVFSHLTAAALHGIPTVASLSSSVHVTIEPTLSRRKQPDLVTHALTLEREQVARVDGLLVTDMVRTLVDIAVTSSFEAGVASLDWALAHGISRADLHAGLELAGPVKRLRAAEAAIEFADAASGSVGESLSRGLMHLLGARIPRLQESFSDRDGLIGTVDFYWPEARLIGEFDGAGKYLRDDYTEGRSAGEVVVAEKRREDRLRGTARGVVRWGWPEAQDPAAFARLLRAAGVPGLR